ncbi:hypothetical protein CO046_04415 [Candidatus Peregrinibacteria bacterium CG_4_9_14_0_2_um_filter_53_11]|nr:MAG: hypothetical protein CO046_04415 [Candidatus Peregrinibacteria bacterium CG_4_9_14_0_2_um_filter_53_11]
MGSYSQTGGVALDTDDDDDQPGSAQANAICALEELHTETPEVRDPLNFLKALPPSARYLLEIIRDELRDLELNDGYMSAAAGKLGFKNRQNVGNRLTDIRLRLADPSAAKNRTFFRLTKEDESELNAWAEGQELEPQIFNALKRRLGLSVETNFEKEINTRRHLPPEEVEDPKALARLRARLANLQQQLLELYIIEEVFERDAYQEAQSYLRELEETLQIPRREAVNSTNSLSNYYA